MNILIKNGRIITATDDYCADIFIEGEIVSAIGRNLNVRADKEIDATDKLVLPGGIDPHVHLDMPFMGTFSSDSYETGTRAALYGGTTMVIDFILQKQGSTLQSALDEWKGRSDHNAVGDYSFHIAVTDFNDETKKEIRHFVEDEGITSFKTFMAYKGALMIDDRQMIGLMEEVKKCGGLINVHATNGDMIDYLTQKHREEGKLSPLYHYLSQPEVTEAEASERFVDMINYTGCPGYIVHLTCEGALNAVRNATKRNQKTFVETCIQYLLLDASLYEKDFEGAKWVMSPPLRDKKDQDTLWAGINQGLVQVVATDHCPFKWEQKLMGKDDFSKIPNGHPAIENRMELLYSEGVHKGKITLNKYVEVACTNPAKIFGMFPRKGTIAVGSDADIVLFDPREEHTLSAAAHHMNVDYSGYEGWKITGKVKTVLLRGEVAIDNNECLIEKVLENLSKKKSISNYLTLLRHASYFDSLQRKKIIMARIIKSGLIQMSLPKTEGEGTIEEIKEAMYQKHIPLIEEAGEKGVQILCFQEIFNTPYFCPGQDSKWYASAEPVPGITTERLAEYAKKYSMVIIVPVYEKEQSGVFYNTAAVIDADGTYLGKYRKNHIPHTGGFWEKYFFKPGNLGYPVFQTRYAKVGVYICYDRHFPDGARCLGLNGAEIVYNPSATTAGQSQYLWKLEQPAHAVANGYFMGCINRVGTEAPWNLGKFYGTSYFVNPLGRIIAEASENNDELIIADLDLDLIDTIRNKWQFFRDRRPETYNEITKP